MDSQSEWHKSADRGGAPTFERKVGEFWLVAIPDNEDDPDRGAWSAFLDVEERQTARWAIKESRDHSSREEAQAAAEKMLDALVAPFVDAARAEEREACAKIADEEAQRARALSERCEDTRDGFAFRGDVAAAESIAYAIRARSKAGA